MLQRIWLNDVAMIDMHTSGHEVCNVLPWAQVEESQSRSAKMTHLHQDTVKARLTART